MKNNKINLLILVPILFASKVCAMETVTLESSDNKKIIVDKKVAMQFGHLKDIIEEMEDGEIIPVQVATEKQLETIIDWAKLEDKVDVLDEIERMELEKIIPLFKVILYLQNNKIINAMADYFIINEKFLKEKIYKQLNKEMLLEIAYRRLITPSLYFIKIERLELPDWIKKSFTPEKEAEYNLLAKANDFVFPIYKSGKMVSLVKVNISLDILADRDYIHKDINTIEKLIKGVGAKKVNYEIENAPSCLNLIKKIEDFIIQKSKHGEFNKWFKNLKLNKDP